jgi:hypothetical protein
MVQCTGNILGGLPGFTPDAVIRAQRKWITERSKNLGARISSSSLTVVPAVPT